MNNLIRSRAQYVAQEMKWKMPKNEGGGGGGLFCILVLVQFYRHCPEVKFTTANYLQLCSFSCQLLKVLIRNCLKVRKLIFCYFTLLTNSNHINLMITITHYFHKVTTVEAA